MKFLVAVDGSDESEEGIAYASDVAAAMDASMTLAHAVDPSVFDVGGSEPATTVSEGDRRLIQESLEDAEDRGLDILEEAEAFASSLGSEVDTELLYGDPITELTDVAEADNYDAIFVGHRGRTDRTDLSVGSVAKQLVARATVPVTVVR